MKHGQLRSVAHNIAASLASGIGILIGLYDFDIFAEAAKSPGGSITVDFLGGATSVPMQSDILNRALELYRKVLPRLCAKHGIPVTAFAELTAEYFPASFKRHFIVTVVDRMGRRTVTEYLASDGQRTKMLDKEGRIRPKPIRRSI